MLLNEHGNEVLMFENVNFITVSWIEVSGNTDARNPRVLLYLSSRNSSA